MARSAALRRREDPNATRPPLRERLAAMRMIPRLIGLVWRTHRGFTLAMVVLRLARSMVPVVNLWIAKLIIDEVILLARTRGPAHELWLLVSLELATVVGGELLARASGLVESLLGDLFTNRISIRIMEHAATLDLHRSRIRASTIISNARGRERPVGSRCWRNCSAWARAR